jgi:hypothetical protein
MSTSLGVIQQFLHPPIGLCTLEAIAGGPYTGLHGFTRPRGIRNLDAMGFYWLITSIPDGYGLNIGAFANYYDRDVLSIEVVTRMLDGTDTLTQSVSTRLNQGHIMFDESFPQVVDVLVQPFVEAEFSWVLLL